MVTAMEPRAKTGPGGGGWCTTALVGEVRAGEGKNNRLRVQWVWPWANWRGEVKSLLQEPAWEGVYKAGPSSGGPPQGGHRTGDQPDMASTGPGHPEGPEQVRWRDMRIGSRGWGKTECAEGVVAEASRGVGKGHNWWGRKARMGAGGCESGVYGMDLSQEQGTASLDLALPGSCAIIATFQLHRPVIVFRGPLRKESIQGQTGASQLT